MSSEIPASLWHRLGLIEILGQRASRAAGTDRADRAEALHVRAIAWVLRHHAAPGALDAAVAALGVVRRNRRVSPFDALVAAGAAHDWRAAVRLLAEHVPVPPLVLDLLRAVHPDDRASTWWQCAELLIALDACPGYRPLMQATANAFTDAQLSASQQDDGR